MRRDLSVQLRWRDASGVGWRYEVDSAAKSQARRAQDNMASAAWRLNPAWNGNKVRVDV